MPYDFMPYVLCVMQESVLRP